MKKYLPSVLFISVFLFLSGSVFAIEPITDANSVSKLIRKIETLPSGGLINLTFKSKIDDSYQPMLIKVPDGYTKAKSWPLLVVLHGLGDGPIVVPSIDSMVQIGPFGRGDMWYRGIGEQDVFECIELAKQIFNIDSDRTYLCGFSMGGAGAFELGLKFPDIWAACVPVCGTMGNQDMIANGGNLPFWINTGSEDRVVPAKYSKRACEKAVELGFKHWKYTEYEGMGHSFWIDWEEIEKWLLSQEKIHSPSSISFTCEKPSKAYWSEIKGKFNCTIPARIDVETASQTIKVRTSNIADYTLYLKDAPVKTDQEITIIENDKQIFQGHPSADGIFNRKLDGKKTDRVCAE
ncbi:MAG: carboxylesterase family protein [Planctomycetota bacterium]|jgi:predicted esterase